MNDRKKHSKSLFRMTLGLWIAVVLLLVLFLVVFSELEAQHSHQRVSGWYNKVLDAIAYLVPVTVIVP